jgi:outer membrane lipoprotein SlyB
MRPGRPTSLAILIFLLSTACVTTSTSSTTWGEGAERQPQWERVGYVASIRETVQRQQGNPGAGAVTGAVVGGLLGSSIGGSTHYDQWGRAHHHASGAGAVAGAIGGAVVGAAASQGSTEHRTYEIFVRFDDGGAETFVYGPPLAFSVGDEVRQTTRGLERMY